MAVLAGVDNTLPKAAARAVGRGVPARRRPRPVNLAGWFLLAALPLLLGAVYLAACLPQSGGRALVGDDALTELFTWHAARGTLVEGVHSHYGFQFPGPMQFYCIAPFYALSGENSNAIILAVLSINLAAVLVALFVVRRSADSTTALAWGIIFTCYQAFVGPHVTSSPWAVWLAHVPFVTTVLLFAAMAAGRLNCLPAALLGCSFVVQTHMAYTLCLAAVMAVSLLAWAAPRRVRAAFGLRQPRSGRPRVVLPLSVALLLPVWLPAIVHETTGRAANLALLLQHFHAQPQYTWSEAFFVSAQALAALPRFLVMGEPWPVDWPMRNAGDCVVDCGWLFAQVAMLAASYAVARRTRRDFDCVTALLCMTLLPATLVSIHCIKAGGDLAHLVYWAGSVSLLLTSTFVATVGRWLCSRVAPEESFRLRYVLCATVFAAMTAGCFYNTWRNVEQVTKDMLVEDDYDHEVRSFADAARSVLRRERSDRCVVCIADSNLWPSAAGLVVQLTKAGVSTGVERPWWTLFGRDHTRARPEDGRFLLGDASWADVAGGRPGVEVVARSRVVGTALLWRRWDAEARGEYSFADMPLFASEYEGFSGTERAGNEHFCWSEGPLSRLVVRLARGHAYRLTLRAAPLYVPGKVQTVTVLLNGESVGEMRLCQYLPEDASVDFPAALVRDRNEIVFRYAYTARPIDYGISGDSRRLGVQFRRVKFEQAAARTEK